MRNQFDKFPNKTPFQEQPQPLPWIWDKLGGRRAAGAQQGGEFRACFGCFGSSQVFLRAEFDNLVPPEGDPVWFGGFSRKSEMEQCH